MFQKYVQTINNNPSLFDTLFVNKSFELSNILSFIVTSVLGIFRDGWRYGQTTHHFLIFLLPLFVKEYCTTKVLGIYGTTRCQMKHMDIVYLMIQFWPSGLDTVTQWEMVVFSIFSDFISATKFSFKKLFWKLSQLKTNYPRDLKPMPNNYKCPKFSSELRSTSVSWSIDEIFKN